MNHDHLFAFESDFVASLRCVPMAVRLKLDRAGIKLSLRQWSRFTPADRQALLAQPCVTNAERVAYRLTLIDLIAVRSGDQAKPLPEPPAEVWERAGPPSPEVVAYASGEGLMPPTEAEWAELCPLQRFVLIKLTRDNHDNVNFAPAMAEFGLGARRAA